MENVKKKIVWVTPDWFLDCDYVLIPGILQKYDIHWIVLFKKRGNRYKESDFDRLKNENTGLSVEFVYSRTRMRDPRQILLFLRIVKMIRRALPDVIYINIMPETPWQIPMFLALPKDKTIITVHQGRVHEGMGHYRYYNFLRDVVYRRIKNVNMFSISQAEYFLEEYSDSHIFLIPLGLKDFGTANSIKNIDGVIRFLSFGSINYAKHIDLLLDAANIVYEKGYRNIKVIIKGACSNWDAYIKHIKYPKIIDVDIRMIDNSEIPNLFVGADFFVQPYRVVSQSGPFKIALNYNLPLITSDLPGFTDEMVEDVTGYTFKCNDVQSLADVMIRAIHLYHDENKYLALKHRLKKHVEENYSTKVLVEKYSNMFNMVILGK